MNHIPVSSSLIKSVAYDPENQLLEVQFHTSKEPYHYGPVSQHEYNLMMSAPSIGKFYHQNIKHRLVTS